MMKRLARKQRRLRQERDNAAGSAHKASGGEQVRVGTPGRQLACDREFLIALSDELNVIDVMLGSVSQLSIAVDVLRENNKSRDPLETWTRMSYGTRILTADRIQPNYSTVLDAPEALIEFARWRLDRVQQLLEAMSRRPGKGKRED